jgi:hypothetical protein
MRIAHVAALAIIASLSATPSFAIPVTWHLAGEVTTGNQGPYFFPFQAQVGDPISFDVTFENQAACSLCESTVRVYDQSLTDFRLTVGNTVVSMPLELNSIRLRNDEQIGDGSFLDEVSFSLAGEYAPGVLFYGDLVFQSLGASPPVPGIDDVQLANLGSLDPALFADASLSFFNFNAQSEDGGYDAFGGRFVSAAVPEPSSLALLLPGLGLAWWIRRKTSAARYAKVVAPQVDKVGDTAP